VDPFNQEYCPRLLWASFAFVNNALPFAGCASHTWSMAVQMQFYALAPLTLLLLRPRSPAFRCFTFLSAQGMSRGLNWQGLTPKICIQEAGGLGLRGMHGSSARASLAHHACHPALAHDARAFLRALDS
jgi:hypothetical protein